MSVSDTLVSTVVLLGLFLLIYLRMSNQTIPDLIRAIRESSQSQQPEVIDLNAQNF